MSFTIDVTNYNNGYGWIPRARGSGPTHDTAGGPWASYGEKVGSTFTSDDRDQLFKFKGKLDLLYLSGDFGYDEAWRLPYVESGYGVGSIRFYPSVKYLLLNVSADGKDLIFTETNKEYTKTISTLVVHDAFDAVNGRPAWKDYMFQKEHFSLTNLKITGLEAHYDILRGGNGNDTLDGGMGADDLFGGKGNDVFYFDSPGSYQATYNGMDWIADFYANGDRIDFSGNTGKGVTFWEWSAKNYEKAYSPAAVVADAIKANKGPDGNDVVHFKFKGRDFLFVNDSNAKYDLAKDLLVDITGFTGKLDSGDFS